MAPTQTQVATPTALPTPTTGVATPSASTSGGDAIGKKITLGDEEFVTLKDAEYSVDGYSEFFKPEAGNVVYAFLIEIEGIDPDGATYNRLYFKMFSDGFEYSHTLFGKDPSLGSSNTLEPGQLVQGWVSFEAPLADQVTLVYEPGIGLDGKATWVFDVD